MSLDEKQLAIRRTGITGTDIPAILGLSPFRTPLDVFLDKLGKAPPVEVTEDMERGTFFEPAGIRWYAHRTGAVRVEQPGTVISKRNPLVIATPDGVPVFADDSRVVLEIKMPSGGDGWGEPGTDAIPQYYVPQVSWQLAALDMPRADVFAVIYGKPRLYHVKRDAELEGLLIEQAERFWRDYVQTGRPPEVTGQDLPTVTKWLRRHEGEQYTPFHSLDALGQQAVRDYLHAYAGETHATKLREIYEVRLKALLAGSPGVSDLPVESNYSRIDWRKNKPSKVTDWKSLQAALKDEDPAFARRMRELIEQHTQEKEGARPFVPRPITKRGT